MERSTRASARANNRTIRPVFTRSTGLVQAKRQRIPPNSTEDITSLPINIGFAVIKNTGPGTIEIRFNDDPVDQFWTLENGKQTPVMQFSKETQVHMKTATGGPVTIECLFWG